LPPDRHAPFVQQSKDCSLPNAVLPCQLGRGDAGCIRGHKFRDTVCAQALVDPLRWLNWRSSVGTGSGW
jgi:hypothetical protein